MNAPNVLIPLDTFPFGEHALPTALRVARTIDASVEIVSVYDDRPMVAGWELDPTKIREATEAYQRHVGDVLRDVHGLEVRRTILGGNEGSTLIDYVQSSEPTIVVMSTHGRGPVGRSWLGNVADRLVTHVSCPVLVVPVKESENESEVDLKDLPVFERIAIPLDGSRRAERSLDWAYRLGDEAGAHYSLIRGVREPHMPASVYLPDAVALREQAVQHGTDEAKEYLETTARDQSGSGRVIHTEVFGGGNVATNIHRYVDRSETDLLVVASHGRSGLSRMLLGSMAEKLIRGAQQPVLVVRSL